MSKVFIMCLLVLATFSGQSFADDRGRDCKPGNGRGNGNDRPRCDDERRDREERERREERRVTFQNVASFRVQKLLETTNTVRVSFTSVKAIRLVARDNSVEIIEARLLLENGREVYMDSVTGGISRDRAAVYTLNSARGERVRSIIIRAVTRNLVGSRANLEIAVGI